MAVPAPVRRTIDPGIGKQVKYNGDKGMGIPAPAFAGDPGFGIKMTTTGVVPPAPARTASISAATPPAPSAQKTTMGVVPPAPQSTSYYGANTNPGVNPTYGYGGQNYGQLDTAGRGAMVNDENRLRSDSGYLQSEWDRANNVLAARQGAGMDTKDQLDYLQKLQGYGAGSVPPPAQSNPVPSQSNPTPSAGVPAPQSYAMTPDQIQAEAKARIDRLIADKTRVSNQTKASLDTSFNRWKEGTADTRVLEDTQNARQLSPFSGRSDYALGMVARERGTTDRQMSEDLLSQKGNVDAQLNDFLSAAPEQQQQMINELTRLERDYGLRVGELTGKFGDQQTLAARTADQNYQLGLGGLTGNINGQRTVQGQELDWNMNPSNPNNQGQIITNEISKLKLQNLPQELRLGLQDLENKVKGGTISNEQANYELNELKDPNSVTNQTKTIQLELGKIDLANAPQEAKLRIQKLTKEIAEIGKAPYRTPEEVQMAKVKLATMNEELSQLKNPTAAPTDVNKYISTLNDKYLYKDPTSNKMIVNDSQALRSAIVMLGLPDQDTIKLLSYYGIPIDGGMPK